MLFVLLVDAVMGAWYSQQESLCAFMPGFTGSDNGYDLWYDCGYKEEMYYKESITEQSICTAYGDCFLESFTNAEDVCMGSYCVWSAEVDRCFCHFIEDPWSPTDGCDLCKVETPAPTYEGQCECNTDLGYGIEDSEGECQCDIEFLKGDDCNGGTGTGSFDSGLVPFAEQSCKNDPSTNSYRMITCYNEDTLKVDWFSDNDCSILDVSYMIHNDTCYYASGSRESVQPTDAPTRSPVDSEAPTLAPTMTDVPTLSPIVENYSLCNRTNLFSELNQYVYDSGDQRWIDDCLTFYETETEDNIPIICGCLGKFPKWMANQYLNCKLTDNNLHYGLTIWSMCYNSPYAQSCGSLCTRRRREIHYDRRRAIADTTFKLTWSKDVCNGNTNIPSGTPSSFPSISPTGTPTRQPTSVPTSAPTNLPTRAPTGSPTVNPKASPTGAPTNNPSQDPTTEYPTDQPSLSPTSMPTCIQVKSWSKETEEATCPEGSWGKTDRGYESLSACEPDYQLILEESIANELYKNCISWCTYDLQSTRNEVYGAHIWRAKGCWDHVTKGHCFKDLSLYNHFVNYTKTLCSETA